MKTRYPELSLWQFPLHGDTPQLNIFASLLLFLLVALMGISGCTGLIQGADKNTATQTYSISGTISPAAGGSGATVLVSGAVSATATADSSGNFSFTGLPKGTYTLTPAKSAYTFTPSSQSVTVNGANISGLSFTAATQTNPTFSISGTISPSAGGSGANVTLSGAASATTTANSSGNYTFSGLANGSYTVTPSKSGYTFAPSGQTVTVNNANATVPTFTATAVTTTYTISGSITGAGGNGATVTLSGAVSATTTANSSGNYTFSGLANGTYAVTPSQSGYTFSPISQAAIINGTNATGINFTATSVGTTYTISGTISPSTGGSGATVALTGAASAATTANSSGNYTFSGLANGSYTVAPSSSGYSYSPTSQAVMINSANVTGVNFTASASSTVIFYDDFTESTLSSQWLAMNTFGRSGNGELQCYVPTQDTLNGGYLVVTAIAQNTNCGRSANYAAGEVQWPTFNFLYGTVEYRAKFAGGQGTWPAIWLLGLDCQTTNPNAGGGGTANSCNWPQAGSNEIDITEIKNGDFTHPYQNVISPSGSWTTCQPTVTDVTQNYHVYDFTWTSTSLKWYIDGALTCTVTDSSHIPTQAMFLIINVAVGGNGGGSVNNSTLPQSMYVDYVQVTQ
jgi:beta-glucanase (GH16 family)